jgi:hypothetical protein
VVGILDRLTKIYGTADQHKPGQVGWREFEATADEEIETLDEALFGTAHLIAGLAAADGAVVMSKGNELLGFGAMISGRLPDVDRGGGRWTSRARELWQQPPLTCTNTRQG